MKTKKVTLWDYTWKQTPETSIPVIPVLESPDSDELFVKKSKKYKHVKITITVIVVVVTVTEDKKERNTESLSTNRNEGIRKGLINQNYFVKCWGNVSMCICVPGFVCLCVCYGSALFCVQ